MDESKDAAGEVTNSPPAEENPQAVSVKEEAGKPAKEKRMKGLSFGDSERKRYFYSGLIGFLGALLVCALVVGSFAVGYAVGNDDPDLPRDAALENIRQRQSIEGQGGVINPQTRREQAGEMLEELGGSAIHGKVVSVEDDKIVIETEQGNQTVKRTGETVIQGKQDIAAGDQVNIILKEIEGGEPEAIMIRVIGNPGEGGSGEGGKAG